jgi:hypothetical protein
MAAKLCFAQKVEVAQSLSPEDLGAYKWILSGTAQESEVVVFRVTTIRTWPNGKITTQIYDTVCYSPGKQKTGTAFFIDPKYFNTSANEEPTWFFRALGGTGWITGEYAGSRYSDDKAEIAFESEKWGRTQKIFETFIKSYADAILLYEDLPSISPNSGWTWSGSPKKQTEQDAALNPDKPRE